MNRNTELIIIKSVGAFVAVASLLLSVYKFFDVQESEARSWEIEVSKPFLEMKLKWCTEAVEVASKIANSTNDVDSDKTRFWQLYWGVMGMVEEDKVRPAMIEFGRGIKADSELKQKAISIAHACRYEMKAIWSNK